MYKKTLSRLFNIFVTKSYHLVYKITTNISLPAMQFEKLPSDIMVNHIFPALTTGAAYNLALILKGHQEFKVLVSCFFAVTSKGCDTNDMAHFARVFFDGFNNDDYCRKMMPKMLEYEYGSEVTKMFACPFAHFHLKKTNKLFAMLKDELLTPGFRASDKSIFAVDDEVTTEPMYTPEDRADLAMLS